MDAGIVDNPDQNRFELDIGGELPLAYYKLDGDRISHITRFAPTSARIAASLSFCCAAADPADARKIAADIARANSMTPPRAS